MVLSLSAASLLAPDPAAPLLYQQEVTMVQSSSCAVAVDDSAYLPPTFMVTTGSRGVLCLHGELDLAVAPRLEDALRAGGCPAVRRLVIDLSDLTFCSCAGLAVLLVEHHRRRAVNSSLLLTAPTDAVRRVLSLTGLGGVFNIRSAGAAAA